jgi:hypothetical protein
MHVDSYREYSTCRALVRRRTDRGLSSTALRTDPWALLAWLPGSKPGVTEQRKLADARRHEIFMLYQ